MTFENVIEAARVMVEDTEIAQQAFCFNIILSVVCFIGLVIAFTILFNHLEKYLDEAFFKIIIFVVVITVFGILTAFFSEASYKWVIYPEIECAHYLQFITMFR